jgi:hypothetical protein
MLSKEAQGYPVYGLTIAIVGSPESSWKVQDVLDEFYQSDYFRGRKVERRA